MKLLKDQRGIGHVVEIVIIAVIILGVGGFIAWRMLSTQQGGSSNTSNSAAQTALEQAIANANCTYDDKDLCKFMTSWKLDSDVKVDATMVQDGQTTTSTFISTQGGANSHTKMNIGGNPYETIVIGNDRYTKTADGTWWKETVEPAQVAESNADYEYDFEEPTTTETPDQTVYKKVGSEACGGLTCLKYQILDPETPDTNQYLWFDTKTYQVRRMLVEDASSKMDQTFSYENISVSAPSPSKDLPAGYYLLPGATEPVKVPTAEDFMTE